MLVILAILFAVYLAGSAAALGGLISHNIKDNREILWSLAMSWLAFGLLACEPRPDPGQALSSDGAASEDSIS